MKGFIEFIRTQGVVGLAVAFILGGAITDLVKSLIENIVNPLIGLLLNHAKSLSAASFMILGSEVKYGTFLMSLINFAVIAAVVYFGVKGIGLERLDKKKE
jgi:large conductance mechanosensitive channel